MLFCLLCINFLPNPPEMQMELKAEGIAEIYAKADFVAVFVTMQEMSTKCWKQCSEHTVWD